MRLLRLTLAALALGGVVALGTACSGGSNKADSQKIDTLQQQVDALNAKVNKLDHAVVVNADGFGSFATPTPVPIVKYSDYGFGLPMPQNVKVTATGLSGAAATKDSGSILASAGGTSVLLVWSNPSPPLSPQESVIGAFDVLQSLTKATFQAQGAGQDLTVDGQRGAYGTFVSRDAKGAIDGVGIIGGWVCPNDQRSYAMTVTGKTLDAVQQSFLTLSDGFQCIAGTSATTASTGVSGGGAAVSSQ